MFYKLNSHATLARASELASPAVLVGISATIISENYEFREFYDSRSVVLLFFIVLVELLYLPELL